MVANFVEALAQCDSHIRERMVWHFYMVDDEVGQRIGDGIGVSLDEIRDLGPLATQTLNEEEQARMKNLGSNGPRNFEGLAMTHCVPNERVTVER